MPNVLNWADLPDEVTEDLEEWFNVVALDEEDKERLLRLWNDGKFNAWDCPRCADRVRSGQPDDWRYFQGVCQPDFTSYPGDPNAEMNDRLCDGCRAHPEKTPYHHLNDLQEKYAHETA